MSINSNPTREPAWVLVSGTQAMMAAKALRKIAAENIQAAGQIRSEFPTAAQNCEALADWYTNIAGALELLDRDGLQIVCEDIGPRQDNA